VAAGLARRRRPPRAGPPAVGLAAGRDAAERETRAIRQHCSERGWSLACVVRDTGQDGRGRAALAEALEQVAKARARRLVVARLGAVVRTQADLTALLRLCARHDVDLVALDVGLDTGTREGRLAARCMLAAGDRRPPIGRRARRNGRPRAARVHLPAAHPSDAEGRR
jgi:hypothetical protein